MGFDKGPDTHLIGSQKQADLLTRRTGKRIGFLRFPPIDSVENKVFYLGLIGGILFLCFLALPLFKGTVYEFDDLNNYHLPFRDFYAHCLKSGDNFLWLPNVFCGFYLHGEGQVGMFHPLHLLLYKTLPLNIAYNLELLLSYPFMMAGMFFFLRRWRIPRDASLLGALIFTFSGFNILHYMHMNSIAVGAHIPWLLLMIDILIRTNDGRERTFAALGLTILTGSQLLLGHPTAFWLSVVTEALYVVLILPWSHLNRLMYLGAAKTFGVLIGAIQLLPHWEAASDSARRIPSFRALMWPSLRPMDLLQGVSPYFFNQYAFDGIPYELKIYIGALPLVLFVYLIIRFKHLAWKRLAAGAVVLACASILMALGKYGGLFRLQLMLPVVGLLRTPCRYVLLFHFALAVGGAIAFADIFASSGQRKSLNYRSLAPLLLIPVAATAPFLLMIWTKAHPNPTLAKYFILGVGAQTSLLVAGPLLFVVAEALLAIAIWGKVYARPAVVVFVIIDLFLYAFTFLGGAGTRNIQTILDSLPVSPADARLYRIQSRDNIFIMKGMRLAGGYASIPPKKELEKYDAVRLRLAEVHSILSKKAFQAEGRSVYGIQLPEPLPRVRLVARAVVSKNPQADLHAIDPASTALVASDMQLQDGPPGSAALLVDRPGDITVATEAKTRQLLVVSESYHDGWHVKVDDRDEPVLRIYGDFMGCVVEPGKHVLRFTFLPKSLVYGAGISLAGILLTTLSFVLSIGRAMRTKAISSGDT